MTETKIISQNPLISTLIKTSKVQRSIMTFSNHRLSENEFLILAALSELGEINSYAALKNRVKLHDSQISVLLSSLSNKGCILRQRNKEDRRSVDISITETGREKLQNASDDYSSIEKYLTSKLGEEKTQEYIEASKEIIKLMKSYNP